MFIVNYQRYYKIPIFSGGIENGRFSRLIFKRFSEFANTIKGFRSSRILLKGFQVREYY